MRWPALAIMLSLLGLGVPIEVHAADPVPVLSDAHANRHDGGLRLIFDITPVPAFSIFTLADPDRLVVDFPAMHWQAVPEVLEDAPYLAKLRYGLFRADRARIVIDLTEPLLVEQVHTQPARDAEPGRLVIELAPTSRAHFNASAGWPEQARWRGRAPAAPVAGGGDIIIAIDPGHGGIDPGASSGGLTEKQVVLDLAREFARVIDARPGMRAYLTRDRDEFVPLWERVGRAHRAGAHLLISVHADSVESGTADGVSIYTLSERGTDRAAVALATRENRADILAGADLGGETDDLTRLLVELAQRGTHAESAKLAAALLGAMEDRIELLRTRPLRQANFQVLKAPDMPSVLLELGFLDSPEDRERLGDPAWRQRIASAVADGVTAWRKAASPGFVAPRE